MTVRHFHDAIHVTALAVQMHRYNCAGLRRNGKLERIRIHQHGVLPDIDKHRPRSSQTNSLGGCDESVRHGDHFVSRSNSQGLKGQMESVRAPPVAHTDTRFGLTVVCEFRLKVPGVLSSDEGAGSDGALDRRIDSGFDGQILCLKIDKWNVHVWSPY